MKQHLTTVCAVSALLLFAAPAAVLAQSVATLDRSRLKLARAKIAMGESLLKKDDYVGAEREFRAAVKTEPSLPTPYLGLGAALSGQRRFTESLTTLKLAELRYVAWEHTVQSHTLHSRQLAERQTLEVEDLYAASVQGRVNNSGVPGQGFSPGAGAGGTDQIQKEQFISRDRFDLEAFQSIPAQVFYLEGLAYLRTGQRDKGIEAMEVCLYIDRRHGLAHNNLAVALFTRGDLEEAREHLDAAIAAGIEPHRKFVADLDQALSAGQVVRD